MERTSKIFFIDKPKGPSSFDVIRILRNRLGIKKMGHAGTLDPQASGLLIVGLEEGTKRLKEFEMLPKTYLMEILLGTRTDTGDLEGRVLERKELKDIDRKSVLDVLDDMVGTLELAVPDYSAIKFKGKPLYYYARRGIEVKPKIRKTEIYALKLLEIVRQGSGIVLKVEMDCAKGTYARAVAQEIGRRMGHPATLQNLRRTRIGRVEVRDAAKLETY